MDRAVFLDRDGVINELVYHRERGIIDSPFTAEQFRLLPGAGEAIRNLQEAGFRVVLVSNQPGIAKGHMTPETFEEIRRKMNEGLAAEQAYLDREYYCLHHPEAVIKEMMVRCECRKPKPGMLLRAAQELGIDLSRSWLIGDNITDVQAGKNAGCPTVFIGRTKCEFCRLMDEGDARPNLICANLLEASRMILTLSGPVRKKQFAKARDFTQGQRRQSRKVARTLTGSA